YWGLTQQEYYARTDVWPLDPKGEILVILMIEDTQAIRNLDQMLRTVPGIGAVLIGEGDLSQELGVPRQYEHPSVLAAMAEVVKTCKAHGVPVGHPHVEAGNAARILGEGYRFLMAAPTRSYAGLDKARQLAGRA
ncbi:MAG: aldolase, partial [Alphaproteobacteria bacterium]|nr:aldolase [Alphaproteobacteria bacterium]